MFRREAVDGIMVYTKRCPKCQAGIKKSGGCSVIRCSRCDTPFCWVCGKDYAKLEYDHDCCYGDEKPVKVHLIGPVQEIYMQVVEFLVLSLDVLFQERPFLFSLPQS